MLLEPTKNHDYPYFSFKNSPMIAAHIYASAVYFYLPLTNQ